MTDSLGLFEIKTDLLMDSRQLVQGKSMKNIDVEGLITELIREKDLPEGIKQYIHMEYTPESSSSAPDSPRQELIDPATMERSIDYFKDDSCCLLGEPRGLPDSEFVENELDVSNGSLQLSSKPKPEAQSILVNNPETEQSASPEKSIEQDLSDSEIMRKTAIFINKMNRQSRSRIPSMVDLKSNEKSQVDLDQKLLESNQAATQEFPRRRPSSLLTLHQTPALDQNSPEVPQLTQQEISNTRK
jgi:hypothetical protein